MNSNINAALLREIIEQMHGKNDMAFKELFALGCDNLARGEQAAGMKAVKRVIDTLRGFANEDFLNAILHTLEDDPSRASALGRQIGASAEINALFVETGREAREARARTPNEFEAVVRDAIHQCLTGRDVELVTQEAGRQLRSICEFEAQVLSKYL